jgi:hypothetical protein
MCSYLHLQQVCDFVKRKKHAKIGDLGHFESHFGLGKNQEYAKIADYGHSEPLLTGYHFASCTYFVNLIGANESPRHPLSMHTPRR